MDEAKRRLRGSASRDAFRLWHKHLGNRYACDRDLIEIDKHLGIETGDPTLWHIEWQSNQDAGLTFTETMLNNFEISRSHRVYLYKAQTDNTLPFQILRYCDGDWRPEPPIVRVSSIAMITTAEQYIEWYEKTRKRVWQERTGHLPPDDSGHQTAMSLVVIRDDEIPT